MTLLISNTIQQRAKQQKHSRGLHDPAMFLKAGGFDENASFDAWFVRLLLAAPLSVCFMSKT
jgi:hypothetical protein